MRILCATAVWAACCVSAAGFINPNFTPVNLVEQAESIVLVEFVSIDPAGEATAKAVEVLKGDEAPTTMTFDFMAGAFEAKGRKVMAAAGGEHRRALMFIGAFETDEGAAETEEPKALLHVGKDWVTLSWYDEAGTWDMDDIDPRLLGTWAGSDVMLRRAVRYILADEEAEIPINANASWAAKIAAGKLAGDVFDARAVDLTGEGRTHLFIAAAAGDRLLRFDAAAGALTDVTSRRKLASRSKAAAWGDVNRDGRADLLSFDGEGLRLYLQRPDGSFAAGERIGEAKHWRGCRSLAVFDAGKAGVGVLAGGPTAPSVAIIATDGKASTRTLPADPSIAGKADPHSRCLLADFTGDGRPDVLLLRADAGWLYRGTGPGAFAAPARTDAALGVGRSFAFCGDYDMDGKLDVTAVATDGVRMWRNVGDGRFGEMLAMSGEIEYIAKRGGIGGMTGDVNNDGRQDVLILYKELSPQIFFNRGFHSFGHARMLDLDTNKLLDAAQNGQQAGCLADVNGDGALDMFLVLTDGTMWLFPRRVDLEAEAGSLAVVAAPAPGAGPITVVGRRDQRCLGAANLAPATPGVLFGLREPGPVTVTWTAPDGKTQTREAFVDVEPVRIEMGPRRVGSGASE